MRFRVAFLSEVRFLISVFQVPEGSNLPSNSCLMLCTLMKNHRGRQIELIFNCESETDKTRWLEAIRPASAQEDGAERIYEPWDCPQVRVVAEYHAIQEDELELEIGEIINVLRKMPDGKMCSYLFLGLIESAGVQGSCRLSYRDPPS